MNDVKASFGQHPVFSVFLSSYILWRTEALKWLMENSSQEIERKG